MGVLLNIAHWSLLSLYLFTWRLSYNAHQPLLSLHLFIYCVCAAGGGVIQCSSASLASTHLDIQSTTLLNVVTTKLKNVHTQQILLNILVGRSWVKVGKVAPG